MPSEAVGTVVVLETLDDCLVCDLAACVCASTTLVLVCGRLLCCSKEIGEMRAALARLACVSKVVVSGQRVEVTTCAVSDEALASAERAVLSALNGAVRMEASLEARAGADGVPLPVARACGLCREAEALCACPAALEFALEGIENVTEGLLRAALVGATAPVAQGLVELRGQHCLVSLAPEDFNKRTCEQLLETLNTLRAGLTARVVVRDATGAEIALAASPKAAAAKTPWVRHEKPSPYELTEAAECADAVAVSPDEDSDRPVRSRLRIANMCCELESTLIKTKLLPLPGVVAVTVNVVGRVAFVRHVPSQVSCAELCAVLNECRLGASLAAAASDEDEGASDERLSWREFLFGLTLCCAFACGVAGKELARSERVEAAYVWLLICVTAVGAVPVVRKAVRSVYRQRRLDVNCLMLVAVAGALALHDVVESAAVVVVFIAAEAVESECMRRVRNALRDVVAGDCDDKYVALPDGRRVETASLKPGDVIACRAGEKVPVDGLVVSGNAAVDESALTGEALAVSKQKGCAVSAGTLVANGYVEVEVVRAASASTLSQLRDLVDEAQASQGRTQEAVTNFATFFTPLALVTAACVALVPVVSGRGSVAVWGEKALVLLVVACPCALVLAAPIATVSAIGACARKGVLVKSASTLEQLARVTQLATDKTGTLTQGRCRVVRQVELDAELCCEDKALRLPASLETRSAHPLATAIVNCATGCAGESLDSNVLSEDVKFFKLVEGRGVSGMVDGVDVAVGNAQFCGVSAREAEAAAVRGATTVFVALDGEPALALAVADPLRDEAAAALERCAGLGCELAMLTGDQPEVAHAVLEELNEKLLLAKSRPLVMEVRAALRPLDKLAWVRAAQELGKCVLMLGDGVNDAPALAAADVGVAMGAGGTAMAVAAADVAIMSDDLDRLGDVLQLARFTTQLIWQNILLSVVIKLVVIALVFADKVKVTLWMAVLADVGSLLLVVCNGVRPLTYFKEPTTGDPDGAKVAADDALL